MKKTIVLTRDGSHTIAVPELNVTYHSVYGALQESRHVFIEAGLMHWLRRKEKDHLAILEVGLGAGLNALLTAVELERDGEERLLRGVGTVSVERGRSGIIKLLQAVETTRLAAGLS